MAEPIYTTDDLTILGGPASIDVQLDFGSEGQRGSRIFVGEGNPNNGSTIIGQSINLFDMYINLHTLDEDYLYLYQYQNVDGVNTWVELVKLIPNQFSGSYSKVFTSGVTTIDIPILAITSIPEPEASNFAVQASITGINPIAHAVSIQGISVDPSTQIENLNISINASELSGSTWTPISGSRTVQIFITMV